MTEHEWLTATDPEPMLEFLSGKASDRKLLLFCAACARWNSDLREGKDREDQLTRIEVHEKYADGLVGNADYRRLFSHIRSDTLPEWPWEWARLWTKQADRTAAPPFPLSERSNMLRDVLGNPFRPVAVDPAWRTSTVVALARGIYDEKAFDRMPILADALQDAGCDNDDVLSHCRGGGPHVRGCWVVDLLLGKE